MRTKETELLDNSTNKVHFFLGSPSEFADARHFPYLPTNKKASKDLASSMSAHKSTQKSLNSKDGRRQEISKSRGDLFNSLNHKADSQCYNF